jgi:aspartate/methionine/tyrosine aminotransferase
MTTVLLQNPKLFDERIKKHHDKNFKIFEEWLKTRNDIELVMPDGKFCCFPKLTNIKDTSEFVEELYQKYNTLIVPGEFYSLKGHVRICFGCETTVLEAALENIGKSLDNYKN